MAFSIAHRATSCIKCRLSGSAAVATPPARRVARNRTQSLRCKAGGAGDPQEGSGAPPAATTEAADPSTSAVPAAQPAPEAPVLIKGQGTAIITGAVSILFGVAYLVLVQLLDSRGGELLPPPPEAFGP
jgi:hypothetical protein